QPRYTRLDAVWMFSNVVPWNLCSMSNCLYVNPFARDMKLPDVLYRLPHARAHEYEIRWSEGENIGQMFGIGEDG
ncbi:MAG: hypothetical protein OXB94_14030, partial [Nitrospira sp.]|nr:hypothetical protein [Nitrospira sp.]